jgi:uncharacterized protein YceK
MELRVAAASGPLPERSTEGLGETGYRVLRPVILVLACLCLFSGCSSMNRMICAMESTAASANAMAAYMPLMAQSTARMADNADRAIPKLERMGAGVEKKSAAVESNIQNYAQSFIDNDRLLIRNLKGIREELQNLRTAIPRARGRSAQSDADPTNAKLLKKVNDLEARLRQLSARLDRMGMSPGPARTSSAPTPFNKTR